MRRTVWTAGLALAVVLRGFAAEKITEPKTGLAFDAQVKRATTGVDL